ncbi:unnamed protein product [Protopolystoma xenopodis]|uniref:Uncharacterized protein n=1 Tax=Protopolystoma xenopodis TaxID=117903 RepID=A0A448WGB7_9PLAT|nr:unnamed protein product [Protopolystoma xenopodis]
MSCRGDSRDEYKQMTASMLGTEARLKPEESPVKLNGSGDEGCNVVSVVVSSHELQIRQHVSSVACPSASIFPFALTWPSP